MVGLHLFSHLTSNNFAKRSVVINTHPFTFHTVKQTKENETSLSNFSRRRHSPKTVLFYDAGIPITVVPTKLTVSNHHSPSTALSSSFEMLPIKPYSHSYSSLKDLLPSVAVNSPKPKSAFPGPDISIRNRLVKQAAWAYLQPMSTTPGSTGGSFFHRLWTRVVSFINYFCSNVIRALDGTLRVIRIRSSRFQRSQMCFV